MGSPLVLPRGWGRLRVRAVCGGVRPGVGSPWFLLLVFQCLGVVWGGNSESGHGFLVGRGFRCPVGQSGMRGERQRWGEVEAAWCGVCYLPVCVCVCVCVCRECRRSLRHTATDTSGGGEGG